MPISSAVQKLILAKRCMFKRIIGVSTKKQVYVIGQVALHLV